MPILQINNLSRSFGGLKAIDQVSMAVEAGSITGVIGPNGAGKTTLFNLISGTIRPDSGSVIFNNKPIYRLPPHRIAQAGIARTFQNIKLFSNMTVLENVMVGMHTGTRAGMIAGMFCLPWTWAEEKKTRKRCAELLDLLGIAPLADRPAAGLAFGQQRAVEMARALAMQPRLVLLDEPAAGLNIQETEQLAGLIRTVQGLAITVLLVEHDMSLVMNICERIAVLSFGKKIAEGAPHEIQRNQEVVHVYLGAAMLKLRNVESGYGMLRVLKGVSLHVDKGEIVAIIGANGAGKTTLLHTVTGLIKARAGEVVFNGKDIRNQAGHRVVSAGCSLVPEGRQVFAPMTVEENLILGAYIQHQRRNHEAAAGTMQEVFRIFPVLKERRHQLAGTLSGGEQQMLAIGRALMAKPGFIMLDEPSMGLAPLVVKTILATVSRLREAGNTILLVEQNSKAALHIADRAYVLETGCIMIEGSARELLNNNDVKRAYLGKEYERINE